VCCDQVCIPQAMARAPLFREPAMISIDSSDYLP
jgi:hypothetical protein